MHLPIYRAFPVIDRPTIEQSSPSFHSQPSPLDPHSHCCHSANRRARRAAVPQSIPHILQAHWDKTATVRENYANLGLMRTLNGPMNQCADGVTATRTGAIGSDEIVSACDVLPLTEHMDPEEWSAELDGGLAAKQMQGKQQRVSCVDSTVKVQVEGQVEADAVDGNDNSDVEFVEEGELEHDADGNVIGVKITRRRVVKEKVAGVSDDAAAVDQRLSRANASSVIDGMPDERACLTRGTVL